MYVHVLYVNVLYEAMNHNEQVITTNYTTTFWLKKHWKCVVRHSISTSSSNWDGLCTGLGRNYQISLRIFVMASSVFVQGRWLVQSCRDGCNNPDTEVQGHNMPVNEPTGKTGLKMITTLENINRLISVWSKATWSYNRRSQCRNSLTFSFLGILFKPNIEQTFDVILLRCESEFATTAMSALRSKNTHANTSSNMVYRLNKVCFVPSLSYGISRRMFLRSFEASLCISSIVVRTFSLCFKGILIKFNKRLTTRTVRFSFVNKRWVNASLAFAFARLPSSIWRNVYEEDY